MASKLLAWAGLAIGLVIGAAPAAASPSSAVPFVGCAQDGQLGPKPAPRHAATINVAVDAATAAKLAYYSAGNPSGVLAPRGWHCFGVYGSSGTAIFVAPGRIVSDDVLSDDWPAGDGPAIEANWASGGTSGRISVAEAIMRIFPGYRAFAQGVIAENIEPASSFPAGPFATDHDVVRSDRVVEYQSPAGTAGLGSTFSRVAVGGPISGVAVLQGGTPDLAFLAVRLPANQQALVPAVVSAFELEAGGPPPAANAASGAPAGGGASPLDVVRAFYTALGRGDGAAASALIIPSKRTGNYAPAALTSYYRALKQPLRLGDISEAGGGVVSVSYAYTTAAGHACDGAAMVRTTQVGGHVLISRIETPNGC